MNQDTLKIYFRILDISGITDEDCTCTITSTRNKQQEEQQESYYFLDISGSRYRHMNYAAAEYFMQLVYDV